MQRSDILKYCDLMTEIKRRTDVLNAFGSNLAGALYESSTIESCYLQFRKILELIAFGSLVANKDLYSKIYADFAKCWNARRLLEGIQKVNPHFYPKPVVNKPAPRPDVHSIVADKQDGFLTRDDFLILYADCGAILHAENPYARGIDYASYKAKLQFWIDKIIGLLNQHQIRLVNDKNLYLVNMSGRDGKVHHTTFVPHPLPETPCEAGRLKPASPT